MSRIVAQQIDTDQTEWPENDEGEPCCATHPEPGFESITWHCTRPRGHSGPHAAHYDAHEEPWQSIVGLAWTD